MQTKAEKKRSSQFQGTVPEWLKEAIESDKHYLKEHGSGRSFTNGIAMMSLMIYMAIPRHERLELASRFSADKPTEDAARANLRTTWPYAAMEALSSMNVKDRDFFVSRVLADPIMRDWTLGRAREAVAAQDAQRLPELAPSQTTERKGRGR